MVGDLGPVEALEDLALEDLALEDLALDVAAIRQRLERVDAHAADGRPGSAGPDADHADPGQ
jgi:hypothetical protein